MNMGRSPARAVYDEVRDLGRDLGLPADLVDRHLFPGPRLAIRVIGTITGEKPDPAAPSRRLQASAVLLSVRTLGVVGDGRNYDQGCALDAVTSTDGMTATIRPRLPRPRCHLHHQRGAINRVT